MSWLTTIAKAAGGAAAGFPIWGYAAAAGAIAVGGLYAAHEVEVGHLEHKVTVAAKAQGKAEKALTDEQGAHARDLALAAAAAASAAAVNTNLSLLMQQEKETASEERIRVQKQNDLLIASLRAQLGGLRGQLAAFAAGGRQESDDTVADCRRRADALGGVLDKAVQLSVELAGDAEREAGDARALRAAPSTGEVKP